MSLEKRGIRPLENPLVQAPRQQQSTVLRLVDGTQVEGSVHVQPGLRLIDQLNRGTEDFIAVTGATVQFGNERVELPFIAVNKSHVVSLYEQ